MWKDENKVTRWRYHAEELRTMREGMKDKECRRLIERLARDYEKMADKAELECARTGAF